MTLLDNVSLNAVMREVSLRKISLVCIRYWDLKQSPGLSHQLLKCPWRRHRSAASAPCCLLMCGSVAVVRLQSLADRVTAFSLNCRCFISSSNVSVSSTHVPVCEHVVKRTDGRLRLKVSHCGAVDVVVPQLDGYRLRRSSVGLIEFVVCCSVTPALGVTLSTVLLWSSQMCSSMATHVGAIPSFPLSALCMLSQSMQPKNNSFNNMHHVNANFMEKWLINSSLSFQLGPVKLLGW